VIVFVCGKIVSRGRVKAGAFFFSSRLKGGREERETVEKVADETIEIQMMGGNEVVKKESVLLANLFP